MIKAPRGTQDIFGPESSLWQRIENEALKLFAQAGFTELRTPIFESTELFDRAVGADSDIVNKEMYTFLDRSERSLTLRPEATASIVRAYIENNFNQLGKPQKLWYRGPMFRYERPQTGRYRQFHQIGVEALGANPPYIDTEIINLGLKLFENLGLKDLKLYINSIGNSVSRKAYIEALKKFLEGLKDQVCEDCQRRLVQNPLRALDCKVPADQALYKNAPLIYDFFDEESSRVWSEIKSSLKNLNINFIEDPRLVRGLDYYNHLVFEIKTLDKDLGAQSTILAGGRYDALVKQLGGEDTPAVGFAFGLERAAHLLGKIESNEEKSGLYIVSDSTSEAQKLALKLRQDLNTKVEYDYEGAKFKKQLDRAIKNSRWAIFYMESERASGRFKIKNLIEAKEHEGLSYDELLQYTKS